MKYDIIPRFFNKKGKKMFSLHNFFRIGFSLNICLLSFVTTEALFAADDTKSNNVDYLYNHSLFIHDEHITDEIKEFESSFKRIAVENYFERLSALSELELTRIERLNEFDILSAISGIRPSATGVDISDDTQDVIAGISGLLFKDTYPYWLTCGLVICGPNHAIGNVNLIKLTLEYKDHLLHYAKAVLKDYGYDIVNYDLRFFKQGILLGYDPVNSLAFGNGILKHTSLNSNEQRIWGYDQTTKRDASAFMEFYKGFDLRPTE